MKLYQAIARCLDITQRKVVDPVHKDACENLLVKIADAFLPSGLGFDNGTSIVTDRKGVGDKMFLMTTAYHRMNDGGSYADWSHWTIRVEASFVQGIRYTLIGRRVNKDDAKRDIGEYILDTFSEALEQEVSVNFRLGTIEREE